MQLFFLILAVFNIISSVFSLPMLNVPSRPDKQAEPAPSMTRPSGEIWTFHEGAIFSVQLDNFPFARPGVVIGHQNGVITWLPLYDNGGAKDRVRLRTIDPSLPSMVEGVFDEDFPCTHVGIKKKPYTTILDVRIQRHYTQTISGEALENLKTTAHEKASITDPKGTGSSTVKAAVKSGPEIFVTPPTPPSLPFYVRSSTSLGEHTDASSSTSRVPTSNVVRVTQESKRKATAPGSNPKSPQRARTSYDESAGSNMPGGPAAMAVPNDFSRYANGFGSGSDSGSGSE